MGLRRLLRGLGKTCISAGLLILLFVAYQLWGTGITEARAQHRLKAQFNAPIPVQPAGPAAAEPAPVPGSAIAIIKIPKIGVDAAVVEGVGVNDLQHGPGHYPGSPLPGHPGNSAIAGHRTTYGAPFYRLNELKPGDDILIRTHDAPNPFEYKVVSSADVDPSDVAVLNATSDNRLTLTTCTPRFTATQRLVVVAKLIGAVDTRPIVAPTPSVIPVAKTDVHAGLSGQTASRSPAVFWGLVCIGVWALAWMIGYLWRRWTTYLLASPIFLACLFFFFQNFARFVPANI